MLLECPHCGTIFREEDGYEVDFETCCGTGPMRATICPNCDNYVDLDYNRQEDNA